MLELITHEPESNPRETPILFIHGAWHGAWCWDEYFLPYFAQQGYIAHALSLRGHGNSPGQARLRRTSIADYVADVAQVAQQLPEPPVVIGHSMGGFTVQKYLEQYDAPAAVLLASIPPQGVLRLTLSLARRHPLKLLKVILTRSLYPLISTPELAREHFFSAAMPQEKVDAYFGRLGDESFRAFLDFLMLNLPHPKRVKTPMLVLGAAGDAIFTTGEIEATARAYNTQAKIFPGMAHDMMLEAGWQAVADHIINWIDEL